MFKIVCIFAFVVFAAASKDDLGHSHITITHFGHKIEHKDSDEHKGDTAEHDFGSHGSFDSEYKFDKHEDENIFAGHDFKFDDHHEDHHEIYHGDHEIHHDHNDHHEQHQEEHHDYHHEPKYSYDYGVHDSHTGDNKNAWETRHGDTVKGGYTLHEADGTQRVVEYTADKHSGFNAIVKRIGHAKHPAVYSKHSHESEGHKSEEYGHGQEYKHEKEHKHEHGATSYNNFYLHSSKH